MKIPDEIKMKHLKTKLYMDICYINKLPFLITKSENINVLTIDMLKNKKSETLIERIKMTITEYTKRGFTVTNIFTDGKFDYDGYKIELLSSNLQICYMDEHISKIEQ